MYILIFYIICITDGREDKKNNDLISSIIMTTNFSIILGASSYENCTSARSSSEVKYINISIYYVNPSIFFFL